jgi:hypothetical protein
MTSGSLGGLSFTQCPDGSNPSALPPVCELQTSKAGPLAKGTDAATVVDFTGTVPYVVADLPVKFSCATLTMAFDGDGSCPAQGAKAQVPLSIEIAINPTSGNSLRINRVLDSNAALAALNDAAHVCGIPSCDALCCISNLCSCQLAGIADFQPIKSAAVQSILPLLQSQLVFQLESAICATQSTGCPAGSTADANGICHNTDGSCPPAPALFAACP